MSHLRDIKLHVLQIQVKPLDFKYSSTVGIVREFERSGRALCPIQMNLTKAINILTCSTLKQRRLFHGPLEVSCVPVRTLKLLFMRTTD